MASPLPDFASASPDGCPACLARMAAQVDLYLGPFLADFSLPDCRDFEDWLNRRRASSRRRALAPLAPLADADVTTMVSSMRPDTTPAHLERIVALTDGVPLFVEELVAMEPGGAPDPALPFNLQDLLMAQLDKLGTPAHALLHLGDTAKALPILDEALRMSDEKQDRF